MRRRMTPDPTQPPPATPQSATLPSEAFHTTRWSRVGEAKVESPEGERALTELCDAYYKPVAAFLRCETRDADAARDLAHDFFAELLKGGGIARADRKHGRFRSYLLGAVKHFLSHRREAAGRLKRGGGVKDLSLNDTEAGEAHSTPDESVLSPDAAFDREWALTVLARAFDALRQECVDAGRGDFFEQVKPWLSGDAEHGDQTALAARCGMNANALKVAVHRMKRRFRETLKAEIAGTLDEAGSVDEEMRALFAALGT
jgi:DNA-directed RNA polymerase specialized sigma24 family protein